ncbi:MAG: discoidin domain-containing protein, partial [Verrucomicrobiota bacterium]
ENSREGWAQIDPGEERSVSRVLVSEGSEFKRCRKFSVQSEIDGQWKPVATGTSIGAQKQVVFEPVKARRFRLTVTVDKPAGMPDGEPVIAEFQLFGE